MLTRLSRNYTVYSKNTITKKKFDEYIIRLLHNVLREHFITLIFLNIDTRY